MIARLSQATGQDYLNRNDESRRRNAESAYKRHEKYNGENQKTVAILERIIAGKTEVDTSQQEFQKLGAGQMKQVSLPIGKNLEETIDLWRGVRTDAISVPQPTTADYQLAATASSKIARAEGQIGLHREAKSEIEIAAMEEETAMTKEASIELPSTIDREIHKLQKRYEQAISSYSYHVQMQKRGFEVDLPSFYKIA